MKFKVITRALIGCLALAGVFVANALPKPFTHEVTTVSSPGEDLANAIVKFYDTATEMSADELAVLSPMVIEWVRDGRIETHLPTGATLYRDEAHGMDLSPGQALVQFPIRGGGLTAPSSMSFVIDRASGGVNEFVEIQYRTDAANRNQGRATYWLNGVLTFDKIVTADGQLSRPSAPVPKVNGPQELQLVFSWKKFDDCLASHGIASWVLTSIGVACGVACLGTLGTGCAVCMSAVVGIGTGIITNCIKNS